MTRLYQAFALALLPLAMTARPFAEFPDIFSADLAGAPNGLALAVAAHTRGTPAEVRTVTLYTRGAHTGWRRAPRLRRPLAPGATVSVAYRGRVPCVAYEARPSRRVLTCLVKRRWRDLATGGLPKRPARLVQLVPSSAGLVSAFYARRSSSGRFFVRRLTGRRWRPVGATLSTGTAIPVLGESTRSQRSLDVASVDVAGDARSLWSLTGGRWSRRAALQGVAGGPMPGGPVRLGARVYLPVIDASSDPWRFGAHALDGETWLPVGGFLNRGPGNAQGVLRVAGGDVWATWQENEPRDDGLFNTRVYAQRIAPQFGSPLAVWAGASIGPGSVETVQGAGRRWVLYMPRAPGRRALTVGVKALPAAP